LKSKRIGIGRLLVIGEGHESRPESKPGGRTPRPA